MAALGTVASAVGAGVAAPSPAGSFASRANTPPRKLIVASAVVDLTGSVAERVARVTTMLEAAAAEAAARHQGKGLDLMIFPEFAICRETGATASERAVELAGPALEPFKAAVRAHHTWAVLPMTLREPDAGGRLSNAAVLFDRAGQVAGIFRKVHPVVDDHGVFENGVAPGDAYPVFNCDFGRLGILICWDMSYEEAWDALGAGGAEIVAVPTASPQNLRPAAQAQRHHYYVVNSAPRDNSSVFDPIGRTIAQVTAAPGFVVQEIDLAYAMLHWSETLHEGKALTDRFGARVGGTYSTREDTGVFWSNDPQVSIGSMIRELGLKEMHEMVDKMENARLKAGPKK